MERGRKVTYVAVGKATVWSGKTEMGMWEGDEEGAKVITMSGADEAESGIKNNSVQMFMLKVIICGSTT